MKAMKLLLCAGLLSVSSIAAASTCHYHKHKHHHHCYSNAPVVRYYVPATFNSCCGERVRTYYYYAKPSCKYHRYYRYSPCGSYYYGW